MIVNGEKWACDACVRGHRVSSCTHRDRKLNHVNKKGRPLTQCPHCRGLRKSRASHVKCDCGELGHTRHSSVEIGPLAELACKCGLGQRCTCALKKEYMDGGDQSIHHPIIKPVLPLHRSDSAVPRIRVPHPPPHRFNAAVQPYHITKPRPNLDTLQMGQHSVDNLPLARTMSHHTKPHARVPTLSRQVSNPMVTNGGVHRRPQLPPLRISNDRNNTSSRDLLHDFSLHVDQPLMDKAVSPGNPNRYSFHDYGGLTLGGLTELDPYMPCNTVDYPQELDWPELDMVPPFDEKHNVFITNPLTPSDVSVEFSIGSQPGLSYSSSGATSEPGDAMGRPLPIRSMPPYCQTYESSGDEMPEIAEHDWPTYAGSQYATSEAVGSTYNNNQEGQMDNMPYGFTEQQEIGPEQIYADLPNQYGLEFDLPMPSTDEAVRDWAQSNPDHMQNPNVDFKFPPYASNEQSSERYSGSVGGAGWI